MKSIIKKIRNKRVKRKLNKLHMEKMRYIEDGMSKEELEAIYSSMCRELNEAKELKRIANIKRIESEMEEQYNKLQP